MLTLKMMQTMWRNADARLLDGIAQHSAADFSDNQLTTTSLVAHAMSQFSHECNNGSTLVENINYSPDRASAIWPGRFSSGADCLAKVGCNAGDPAFPIKLLDLVYGNRNGNRPGTSDGSKFIGRGLAQVTGRDNYEYLGKKFGLNLVDQPELVNDPEHALKCGIAIFIKCGCLDPAQNDNVAGVTKRLNGGSVGLDDRTLKLEQWKNALVQNALNGLGADPVLLTDGEFGKNSIAALMTFQRSNGLEATGRGASRDTLEAIDKALASMH